MPPRKKHNVRPTEGLNISTNIKNVPKNAKPIAEYTPPLTHTKEQFEKMGYQERLKLYQNDPDEYNRLSK